MADLKNLPFHNTYARLGPEFGRRVEPTPLLSPRPVAWNPDVAELLGIDAGEAERPFWVDAFSGNAPLPGAEPLAMLYAGHQFGGWVPQLGDGRAILLGQVRAPNGGSWDLHLKGGGVTPFSRGFDGRAVLRSTIREYLCGEAMHGLGIPTTRALCMVSSDEPVRRETVETAATLVRVAPSHVRFGSFQVFASRGQPEHVRTLADYVIREHLPELEGEEDRYGAFLAAVVRRTARLVARWQMVGWTHGVLNTDNMSILGLTLDYGPFAFMDDFDPRHVPNHTDHGGRYAYAQQPGIGLWNLTRLAESLLSLMDQERAVGALGEYEPAFLAEYGTRLRAKLGLATEREEDAALADDLFALLAAYPVDFTGFWRRLGRFDEDGGKGGNAPLRDLFVDRAAWDAWAARYADRLKAEGSVAAERRARMDAVNPKYVLRTYLAERAIRQAQEGDFAEVERLRRLLRDPFAEQPEMESYAEPPPEWGRALVLSCSS